ncbi:MAG: glutamate mutase L, partial [Anaerolineales bacterium]
MPISLVKADSLLAIDVGSVHTRVSLFDVVEARYRFLGSGISPNTLNYPFNDIQEGIHQAIEQLQSVTGRQILSPDAQLITPEQSDGSGVDLIAATISAYPPVKVIVAGLLEDLSVESAAKLAGTIASIILHRFSLNDHLTTEARLNAIVQSKPDLILVAGGTEQGAQNSVWKILETIGLARNLLAEEHQPHIVYLGNTQLHEKIKNNPYLGEKVYLGVNIHPTLEEEQFQPAIKTFMKAFHDIQQKQIPGYSTLLEWSKGSLLPASLGWERIIRLLDKVYDPKKGVLGVDIGSSTLNLVASFSGETKVSAFPQFGLTSPTPSILETINIDEIKKWLIYDFTEPEIKNLILTRQLYPGSIPMTEKELDFEYALSTVLLQNSLRLFLKQLSKDYHGDYLPAMEPIIASGAVLTNAHNLARSGLVLLNGLQPIHITTLVL